MNTRLPPTKVPLTKHTTTEEAAMKPTRFAPPSHRAAALVTAAIASMATIGGVLALFHSVSSTPGLSAEHTALVSQCDAQHSTDRREARRWS